MSQEPSAGIGGEEKDHGNQKQQESGGDAHQDHANAFGDDSHG
jgi:hypothetical protein